MTHISQITLVDQNEHFVFKPLLYELINGGAKPDEVAPRFKDLLAPMTSTTFIQVCSASPLHTSLQLAVQHKEEELYAAAPSLLSAALQVLSCILPVIAQKQFVIVDLAEPLNLPTCGSND